MALPWRWAGRAAIQRFVTLGACSWDQQTGSDHTTFFTRWSAAFEKQSFASVIRAVGSRNLVAIAMQPSFANPQVRDEVAQRSKEIALGFFFDELFAVGGFVRGDDFFRELAGHIVVVRELHGIGG